MINYTKKKKQHIITFNYDESIISYKDYIKMIDECTKWYNSKISKIISDYENLVNNKNFNESLDISNKHKNIVIKLIKKILKYYPIINDIKFGLFISNSFARGTNLIDSDVDLNFVYEKESEDIGLQIEEQISYAITKIVGKYRDFVHDSITHKMRLLPKEIEYIENEELIFIAKWNKKKIKYPITSGNEKLMLNYCYGKRDINSYIKYISSYIEEDTINEWVYYQKIIFGEKYVSKIFDELIKKEKAIINLPNYNHTFNKMLDKLKIDFTNELREFEKMDFNDMKIFKKYFKNITYNKIFTVITLSKKVSLINNNTFNYSDIYYLYKNNLISKRYQKEIINYFGNIMSFNYICDLQGIEFRTRYSNILTSTFKNFYKRKNNDQQDLIQKFIKLSKRIYLESLKVLCALEQKENIDNVTFNPLNEYINISNYSPFSHINEVSIEYQKKAFMLPFIKKNGNILPVHPDTFSDLNIDRKDIVKEILVYPTSSYRTVYDPENNICYKLVLLRKITRSIRNLPNKELERSMLASKMLNEYKFENFTYLKEDCIFNDDQNFNYIIREMPKVETFPWFYVIASQKFEKDFQLKCITNIIKSWMFFASKGIYFESPHTQNYLVDKNANIYYRDLSDIRNLDYEIMKPSFLEELSSNDEILSIFFDRAICNQNLDHLFRYCQNMNDNDIKFIKDLIINEIKKYNLPFPNYSMDYSKKKKGHIPEKVSKVKWR